MKELCTGSPIEGLECQIFKCFARGTPPRLNALEMFSGIIIYGSISIEQKAKILIKLFDFDRNKTITIDECAMLCTAFLNAIGCMTAARMPPIKEIYDITEAIFDTIDKDSSHRINYVELVAMIQSIRDLYTLLSTPEIKSASYQFQLPPVAVLKPRLIRSTTPNSKKHTNNSKITLNLNNLSNRAQIAQRALTERSITPNKERFMLINRIYITKL